MRTRHITSIMVGDNEVDLEYVPDGGFEPITIQPTPDTLVVGYLLHDSDCQNPMEMSDCEGELFTDPSRYAYDSSITDDKSAPCKLGLNEFGSRGYEPEYNLELDGIAERVTEMLKAAIKADPELVTWFTASLMETGMDAEKLMLDLVNEMQGYRTQADWGSEEDKEMISRLDTYESLAKTAWEALYDEGKVGEYLAVPVSWCSNNHGPGTASAYTTSLDSANAVWVPDKCAIENMNFDGCVTYADKLKVAEKYAEGVLENYTLWCNGEVYGIVVESFVLEDGKYVRVGDTDSCWDFIGREWAEKALKEQMGWAEKQVKEAA